MGLIQVVASRVAKYRENQAIKKAEKEQIKRIQQLEQEQYNDALLHDKYGIIDYYLKANKNGDGAGVYVIFCNGKETIVKPASRSQGHYYAERTEYALPPDIDEHRYGFYLADNGILEIKMSSLDFGQSVFIPENPSPYQIQLVNDYYDCCKRYVELPNLKLDISVDVYTPNHKFENPGIGLGRLREACDYLNSLNNKDSKSR